MVSLVRLLCGTTGGLLQVKLLKCLVDNIVVDISFETLGGLCTVAFLESIDRHIQGNHLFKRSVILVSQHHQIVCAARSLFCPDFCKLAL